MAKTLKNCTAANFIEKLTALGKKTKSDNLRFFRDNDGKTKSLGTGFGQIFKLAKDSSGMSLSEIEKLLKSSYYEARMGAVSIMDFQARDKHITPERKKDLYDLYIQRHDRINNWDLVDRSAPHVVGGYLVDKPRKVLYQLAKSKRMCERRTAIVSTWFFIRKNDVDDTFKIAEILINDPHDLIQKAVGSWVREAGKRDKERLTEFLDEFAKTMPRTTLRYAVEKLGPKEKAHYLNSSK
jgi:3-methyladenine DNA glycosylase AlkD